MESGAESTGEESVLPEAVDSSKFKTCNQIAFYRRQKLLHPGESTYRALLDTFTTSKHGAEVQIINEENKVPLLVQIFGFEGSIIRVKINELKPLKPRYEVPDVLVKEPITQRMKMVRKEENGICLASDNGACEIHITVKPFQIDITSQGETVLSINSLGLLFFEHLRPQPASSEASTEGKTDPVIQVLESVQDDLGLWEEKFQTFVDVKANGPSSVGLDFRFHGYEHFYGIPEHADTLQLRTTSDDPYRLYNLDVFAYQLWSRMGLYGSVPLLLAHKPVQTIGLFWFNASETLVDISTTAAVKYSQSILSPGQRKERIVPQTDVRWMSESGIIDAFVLLGPSPLAVFKQYAQLTGIPALPPLFSLGYHQCRWNYEDEADVKQVDAGFDEHDIPYDVIWLDIEHTESKCYFTWDKQRFPNPKEMQTHLQEKKRKLVVINDPHIKVDKNYQNYTEAKKQGYLVRDRNGQDFIGSCWPGPSSYLDFTHPEAREWYAGQFSFDKYQGSSEILFVWNDMNEPSVFLGPELTMQKDLVHRGGWEHREVHNLYGFYQQMATADGLLLRSKGKERPFVLSRAFFAGSQRYGAVWTGDNVANWDYLRISTPMLLTISLCGISFCGADVGGFYQDPDPELLVRWYQAGAYQPFFRGHACSGTKRREPWLLGEENMCVIREAIRERYELLPYWYTLFYRAHVFAEPVMRPIWVEFPDEITTFGIDHEYFLGNALLVHPVTDAGVTTVDVFLPGSDEIWYNIRTFKRHEGAQTLCVPVSIESIPVFQRGGSIVPRKTRVCRSTEWMKDIPYVLHVALDFKGSAVGELFLDDGHSFDYQAENKFIHKRFSFNNNTLSSSSADRREHFQTSCEVEEVLIMGFEAAPSSVTVQNSGEKEAAVRFNYDAGTSVLTLENLCVNVGTEWTIKIHRNK
ncbi:neutral alpha-glucosidase C [Latimeria chalumnae]|uniref:neutral alpha-glucosidase C n=1 Tax=Latimeria chalumnae TaxID=7897 RepID=UPI00313B4EBB